MAILQRHGDDSPDRQLPQCPSSTVLRQVLFLVQRHLCASLLPLPEVQDTKEVAAAVDLEIQSGEVVLTRDQKQN